jgi:hypothetical protein
VGPAGDHAARKAAEAGLPAAECVTLVRGQGRPAELTPLDDDELWGKRITDERYLVVSG